MKQLFFCINFTFFTLPIFAQKNETIINFTFDTATFKYPAYEISELIIVGKTVTASIIESSTKKLIADFLNLNKNRYYFTQKNNSGNTIIDGFTALESKPYKTIKTLTFNEDGEVNGYINYNYYTLKKVGIWNEKITDSTSCFGKYLNKQKDSIWTYSKSINKNISVLEKQILYKKGVVFSEKSLNLFTKSNQEVEKEILGNWTVFSDYNPNDTIVSFHKIKNKNKGRIRIQFNQNKECKIIAKTHHNYRPIKIYNWAIQNKQINIYSERKCLFTISYFNKDYFVLIYK